MDLVLLSGNSISHKKWIEEVADTLKPLFDKIYLQYYKHWETGDEVILMDHEIGVLKNALKDLDSYLVFGKSAGTLLTMRAVYEGFLQPVKCVLVGVPVPWGEMHNFAVDAWSEEFSVPTLFIQKTQDPAMPFDDLSLYLQKQQVRNYRMVELEGDSHYYGELELLKDFIAEFISQE
jgi:hypothetical protein